MTDEQFKQLKALLLMNSFLLLKLINNGQGQESEISEIMRNNFDSIMNDLPDPGLARNLPDLDLELYVENK